MKKKCGISETFENSVYRNLISLGFDVFSNKSLGLAVSGGADSVSLLVSCAALSKKYGFGLKVITVDHKIRSEEESGGDADFVQELCNFFNNQGFDVAFLREELNPGEVLELSKSKRCGIEAAARELRYRAFYAFLNSEKLDFIALAHNQNDQLETLLMRFLQGSGSSGLFGIRQRNDVFIRPLINISRDNIEEYLKEKSISWRTDSTNLDNKYYRNRVRNELIPFLKNNFTGFDKALISGAEKTFIDDDYFESVIKEIKWTKNGDEVYLNQNEFRNLHKALKIRLLYKGFDTLGDGTRLPFSLVKEFLRLHDSDSASFELSFEDLGFGSTCEFIYIKKRQIIATDIDFFAIIEKDGVYTFPFGTLLCRISECGKTVFEYDSDFFELENLKFPFAVRSVQSGDKVRTNSDFYRGLKDIFSSWHVPDSERKKIPLVQELSSEKQEIVAVLGCTLGFKNWIVK